MKYCGAILTVLLCCLPFFSCDTSPGINPADGFSLTYEAQGSEYPATTRLTVTATGECTLWQSKPDYGDFAGTIENLEWKLPDRQFRHLVTTLVEELDFFSLPPEITDPEIKFVMDAATVQVSVSWKGRTHRIGGYNAYDFMPYRPVLELLDETITSIEKNAPKG